MVIGGVNTEAGYHPQKMEEWWMNVDPRDFDMDNAVLASATTTRTTSSNHEQNGEVAINIDRKRRNSKSSSGSRTSSRSRREKDRPSRTAAKPQLLWSQLSKDVFSTFNRMKRKFTTASANADESSDSGARGSSTQETTRSNSSASSARDGSTRSTNNSKTRKAPRYSISELVASLDDKSGNISPELERRVRDFKFAQNKRREKHGDQRTWGIFGLYAHLSDIRADLEWAEDAAWRRVRNEPYLSWTDFASSRDEGMVNRPFFTYFMLVFCTIMMLVTFAKNGWRFEPLNVNPLAGPSPETLIDVGARYSTLIVNEGQWYRLLSPMFLHAGLIHYFVNMLALWYVGAAIEQSHGLGVAAMLFFIPAVGGNILSAIFLPQYISVGASGGIFGLIGGCVADIAINWDLLFLKTTTNEETRWRHARVIFWLLMDVLVNCFIGLTPFVDNFTHLGGFLYGLCCGVSTIERLAVGFFGQRNDKWGRVRTALLRSTGLIVSLIMIMVTTVLLSESDGSTNSCHGCRFLSCVPFPFGTEDKWWHCDDCDFVVADLYQTTDGSGLYEMIELTCPNGIIQGIDVADDGFTDKDEIRFELPTYCRLHCENVYISN